jgi:hypothetical protein
MSNKRILQVFVVFAVICLVSGIGCAAEPRNVIKINPLGFILGLYNADYEIVTSDNSSVAISGLLLGYSLAGDSLSALGVGFSYRHYSKGTAPYGFYIGPMAAIAVANVSSGGFSASGAGFSIGGVAGHQWIQDSGFAFDLQASIMMNTDLSVSPGFGFSLGYAW